MYRENIYEVMEATAEKVSTLVIPTNTGLKGYAWKVLKEAGLDLDKAQQSNKIALRLGNLTLLLRRGEDIPQVVMDEFGLGNLVLGVTGDDLVDEYRLRNPKNTLKIENTYDWFDERAKYFRPALCLVGLSRNPENIPLEVTIALNGKYEFTGRLYISKNPKLKGRKFYVKVYSGGLEYSVASGANEYGIDTVYSGDSVRENGLIEVGKPIRFSDLVVISPLSKDKSGLLERMAKDIPREQIIKT